MIIYRVLNKRTGKSYVGQTVRTLEQRKAEHMRLAQKVSSQAYPTPLHRSIHEIGSGEFIWEVIEVCTSEDQLNTRERYYIKLINCITPYGYNQTDGGGGLTSTTSEEIRFKIANSMRERHKDPEYTANLYPKLKGLAPPNKGVPMSEEQKKKVSTAKKAVYSNPTYVNPNVGQKREGKALENLRESFKTRELPTGQSWEAAHGTQYTLEVRQKMREKKLGKKPANTKKVLCIDTGQIFEGLSDAAKALNVNRQSIYLQIKGKLKAAGGLHFKYV